MYIRKTIDVWYIECLYPTGWEIECCEYTYKDAKVQSVCYRENTKRATRIVKRRERKE